MNFNFCKLFFVLFTFFVFQASAKNAAAQEAKRASQTKITSDIMDIKRKNQTIDFLGNVVVKNGADSMTAKKMTVLYDDNKNSNKSQGKSDKTAKNGSNSIKKIDAYGDVRVFGADFVGSSDKGHYDPNKNLFVLEENVIINNGSSIGKGDKFLYSLDTRKGQFVGKSGTAKPNEDTRVIVVIGNDAKKSSKNKKK